MYRHCLFCQRDLGANEVIEGLPIGRRLAFDESKARLWVICTKCERWNLTPFDSRLEAIEQCEREFRGTKLRVSTENIGLARVTEGLLLIRIGEPMRPEMAAWRYGDQFGRRRRRHAVVAGAGVVAVGAAYAGLSAIGVGGGFIWYGWSRVFRGVVDRANRIVVVTPDGRRVDVVPSEARNALVRMDSGTIQLSVESKGRIERWHGEEARAVAGVVVARANVAGAGKADVRRAVELISLTNLKDDPLLGILGRQRSASGTPLNLDSLTTAQRVALEMSLHEEQERRALHGELKQLEDQWRAAEEIAAIADSLTLPESIDGRLRDLKNPRNSEP